MLGTESAKSANKIFPLHCCPAVSGQIVGRRQEMPRKGIRRASSTSILHQGNRSLVKKKGHKTLSKEDVQLLTTTTRFSEAEIKEWYRWVLEKFSKLLPELAFYVCYAPILARNKLGLSCTKLRLA